MQDEIKKVAPITLYDEPYEKTVSDSGIVFYNLDVNTAVLEFTISKKSFPLQISDENVDTYVYLEGTDQNGNSYGQQLDVEYIDPFNGLVRLTVPDDYLKAVNGSVVTGQMYIGIHKENKVPETKADTAVLNEFRFTVKDALINSVSAVTKIEYIRMFDKLKDEIKQRVKDIEDAIANGSDYVAQMKNVLADGLKQINTTVTQAKKDVNDTATNANASINSTKDSATKTINDTTSANVNASNKAKQDVLDAISNAKLINKDTYDSNNAALNKAIIDGDVKALNDAKEYVDNKSWQKYSFVDNEGKALSVNLNSDFEMLKSLNSGFYYASSVPTSTMSISPSSANGFLEVYVSSGGTIKHLIFRPSNSQQVYILRGVNNSWSNWELINPKPNFSDTGWLPLTLTNNVQVYSSSYLPQYKLVNNNGDYTLKLKGAVKNITTSGVIVATLPSNVASQVMMNSAFVQNCSVKSGNATMARWSVVTSGDLKLDGVSFSNSLMTADDFYPINAVIPL